MKNTKKKGFTLAELLIVVAIVAILAAIAIPLLIGATNKAETAVQNANIRTIKSLATVEILTNEEIPEAGAKGWKATADVAADGTVTNLTIVAEATGGTSTCAKDTTANDGSYDVIVYIEAIDNASAS